MSLAFPNRERRPAHRRQIGDGLLVSRDVSPKFGAPILHVAFRHPRAVTLLMPMPETSVHKQRDAVLGKDYIRIAREIAAMQSESQAEGMGGFSHPDFRRGVLAADAGHDP
jgi:hypothetical protein